MTKELQLGKNLRGYLKTHQISQTELSKELGIRPSTLHNYIYDAIPKELILDLAALTFLASVGGVGIQTIYEVVRSETISKLSKGLSPLSGFTQKLTCQKFNDKMGLVPVEDKHCKRKSQ